MAYFTHCPQQDVKIYVNSFLEYWAERSLNYISGQDLGFMTHKLRYITQFNKNNNFRFLKALLNQLVILLALVMLLYCYV